MCFHLHAKCRYRECPYDKCHKAEFHGTITVVAAAVVAVVTVVAAVVAAVVAVVTVVVVVAPGFDKTCV